MDELPSAEKRRLRARAHALNPVVLIGNNGLTPSVVTEIDRSLKAHELIKIRASGMEYDEREEACLSICEQTGALPVQHIGKLLVIYRKNPDPDSAKRDDAVNLPKRRAAGDKGRARRNERIAPPRTRSGRATRQGTVRRNRSSGD